MSDQTLVDHASPTLAGLKTGALFPVHYPDEQSMREDIRRYNRRMQTAGLRLLPVRYRDGRALLYLYRGKDLDRDLGQEKSRRILASAGYTGTHASECVCELVCRMRQNRDFPHEVGVFLGYPPEDVEGFIQNHAKNFKFVGTWKVYANEEEARNSFDRYRKCTRCYQKLLSVGIPLEKLLVSNR